MSGKTLAAVTLALLLATYSLVTTQAQPIQADKLQKLISLLVRDVDRLETFVKNRVANATKQQLLLQQLEDVRSLLNKASTLASEGKLNESAATLREARAELVDVCRQLVPETIQAMKKFNARSIDAEIRALRNQVSAMRRVASIFQEKGANTSAVLTLLDQASSLLDQASQRLKANDTSGAAELVRQAWAKVKEAERLVSELAAQLQTRELGRRLEQLGRAFNATYVRLSKVSPKLAREFGLWATEKLKEIRSLIAAGKYAEASAVMRGLLFHYHEYAAFLTETARVEGLAQMAKQLANVVQACNATLAGELRATADSLLEAAKAGEVEKALKASQELKNLILEARFACRPRGPQRGKP